MKKQDASIRAVAQVCNAEEVVDSVVNESEIITSGTQAIYNIYYKK